VATSPNPVVLENRRQGTSDWQGPAADRGGIEGYAEPSVVPGGALHFHVSTSPAASYEIRVYRLGWYGGSGARLVATLQGSGSPQPRTAGPSGAGWPITQTLTVPSDWVSGYYLVRFVLTSGPQAGRATSTIVVVRAPPPRRSRILVQVPVNTWQAYNPWGGKSLYDFNSDGGVRASAVSFERPYSPRAQNAFEWEIHLVRFLEREGYDVSYQTDVDTHVDPGSLLAHRLVMVAGHDEYWSRRIRDAFEAARDAGTNLAFLGANIGFWQVRYEAGGRTIVGYKSKDDPLTGQKEQTVQFRDLTPSRPECSLLGVQTDAGITSVGDSPRGYSVAAPADPWFAGTGFTSSTVLDDLVGYEWDTLVPGCIPGAIVLFHWEGKPSNSDAVRYTAASGARVFSAGSLQFTWGLDDFPSSFSGGSHPVIPGLVRFMRNALADLGRPAPPLSLTSRRTQAGLVLHVTRRSDPRIKEIVLRRDGRVVCRTATGTCTDRNARGGRAYVYTAAAADEWGESTRISRRVVVAKRLAA
jgi:hypothetical protein